jgi:hypothetical protein
MKRKGAVFSASLFSCEYIPANVGTRACTTGTIESDQDKGCRNKKVFRLHGVRVLSTHRRLSFRYDDEFPASYILHTYIYYINDKYRKFFD